MRKLILLLTIICFSVNSTAGSSVMLISPLLDLDQRDLPLSFDKTYTSYSNYYLDNSPKEKNIENLLGEFENAQKYYLVKSYELARQYYENVVSLSDVDEWSDVQRKIIFLSYIRLSELNQQNEQSWIDQALRFSLEIDPSKLEISKDSIKKINDTKKHFLRNSILWQVNDLKKDFKYILINGHNIDLKKIETIKIPPGQFRVTFLSDVYKPQTYQVSSQQIPLLIPTRIPFVSGTCEKPFVNNEGELPNDIAAYYSKDCIKYQSGKMWSSTKTATDVVANFSPTNEPANAGLNSFRYEEPVYKKSWFLVTLGILGTAAAIYAMNKDEKKTTHETVNGF